MSERTTLSEWLRVQSSLAPKGSWGTGSKMACLLNVSVIKLTGAITNPDEVGTKIVGPFAFKLSHCLLKVKNKAFMGSEKLQVE